MTEYVEHVKTLIDKGESEIFYGATAPSGVTRPPPYRGFTITLRHSTLGRTPLDECKRPLPDNTQHSVHVPSGIRTRNPGKRESQNHALDRAPTGIGRKSEILERYPVLGSLHPTKKNSMFYLR
jgi:hypothetical protein